MTDTVNSKKVRLKRNPTFLAGSQTPEAQEFFGLASQGIGSYFESTNANRVASGLTTAEELILLPAVLGLPAGDRDFWAKRNEFYGALEVKVPYKEGIELEIGLTDNSEPLSATNLPINLHQYLRYRFVANHPWVAQSETLGRGNQLKSFYIHDDVEHTEGVATLNDAKDEATVHFLKLKNTAAKVEMMMTLMGVDYRDIVGQNAKQTAQLRVEKLRDLLNADPVKFTKIHEDRDFEVKYNVRMMLNTQVLKQVGQKILITETGESLGNEEAAVQFFKDEDENSDKIGVLKAKLQEAVKAGKKVKRTLTSR